MSRQASLSEKGGIVSTKGGLEGRIRLKIGIRGKKPIEKCGGGVTEH